ncbi:tetratricopeptide repeat-containing sensor histidine kinase [Flavobacterium sp. ASW18X]|uniref:tetratricopeptide repeat-containing sensor histidine kinase n=1 Tax=Flavobacterium sp. ASW18X TaxID=2572595 RepID=UPI0010AE4579|nr:tetratricopeptide repeat-containing sensor histidine kinase [Flavobacterium sp. ASW18X]TKD66230.1 sensor histidine kinase [Flavobacterium sp. ASW18X]
MLFGGIRILSLCIGLFFCFCITVNAQTAIRDSLQLEIQKLKKKNPNYKSDSTYFELRYLIGKTYLYRNNDSLRIYGEKLIIDGKQYADKNAIALGKLNVGFYHFVKGHKKEATRFIEDAICNAEDINASSTLVKLYNLRLIVAFITQDYTKAYLSAKDGLTMAQKINDKAMIATFNMNIGTIFSLLRAYDKALYYNTKALAVFDDYHNVFIKAEVLSNRAFILYHNKAYHKAEKAATDALTLLNPLNEIAWITFNYNNLGYIYLYKNDLEKAEKYFNKANSYFNRVDSGDRKVENYLGLAEIYLKRSEFNLASANATKALELATKSKNLLNKVQSIDLCYKIALATKNTESALAYLQESKKLSDSLLNLESHANMLILEAKESYKAKRLKEEEKANNKIANNKIYRYIIILLAVHLILLSIFIYATKRKQQERNKKLDQEVANKNKLLSIIGHDITSPIFTLQQSLELFKSNYISSDDVLKVLERMKSNINYSSFTLKNIQLWAQANMENLKTTKVKINVYDICNQILKERQTVLKEKNIKIQWLQKDHLVVKIDKNHLTVIIDNILSNAKKYSEPSSIITIKLISNTKEKYIEICDSGPGIPQEKINNIYKNITLNPLPGTQREKGTGIGLQTSILLAKANSSTILLKSNLGQGTCVQVKFN